MGIKTREWRYKNKFTYMSINNLKIRKHKIHVNVFVHVWKDKILQHRKLMNYMYMEISELHVNVHIQCNFCESTCMYKYMYTCTY